jgi:hypothetical protein
VIAILVILGSAVWTFLSNPFVEPVTTTVPTTSTVSTKLVTGSATMVQSELQSIDSPDFKAVVTSEGCSGLQKDGSKFIIDECSGGITVFFNVDPINGNWMKICGGWLDGRDLLLRSKRVLDSMGIRNTSCAADTVTVNSTNGNTVVYNICGSKIYLDGGCIV